MKKSTWMGLYGKRRALQLLIFCVQNFVYIYGQLSTGRRHRGSSAPKGKCQHLEILVDQSRFWLTSRVGENIPIKG